MPEYNQWFSRFLDWIIAHRWLLISIALLVVVVDLVAIWQIAIRTEMNPPTSTPTKTPRVVESMATATLATPTATTTALPEATKTSTAVSVATQTPLPTETLTMPTVTSPPLPTATWTPTKVLLPTETPSTEPTAMSTPVVTGWRGEYFANATLSGAPFLVRGDRALDFSWEYGAPFPGLPADEFSVRWLRNETFQEGLYTFDLAIDDGLRFWLDGELVVDEWRDGARRDMSLDLRLSAGEHELRVEYYDRVGQAVAQLSWTLATVYPEWKGEYWPNKNFEGEPILVRNDPDIDFDWQSDSPAVDLPADDFAVRWTRTLFMGMGTYLFHIQADDGVRLFVDGQIILDAWYDHPRHELTVEHAVLAGEHIIQFEYYEHKGESQIKMWWDKLVYETYPDWKGEYWSNLDTKGDPILVRNDLDLDFEWRHGSPAVGMPADEFSARWTRNLILDSAIYRFHILVDDGVRLWLDGEMLIDAWYDGRARRVSAEKRVVSGLHTIQIVYYERDAQARIRVWWDQVGELEYSGWKGEYWDNSDLLGTPILVRDDPAVDFSWELDAPAPSLPADYFSARWSRHIDFEPGLYHLLAWADDGLRVYVDGTLMMNHWQDETGKILWKKVRLNGLHLIEVEFWERDQTALVRFWWNRILGEPKTKRK